MMLVLFTDYAACIKKEDDRGAGLHILFLLITIP